MNNDHKVDPWFWLVLFNNVPLILNRLGSLHLTINKNNNNRNNKCSFYLLEPKWFSNTSKNFIQTIEIREETYFASLKHQNNVFIIFFKIIDYKWRVRHIERCQLVLLNWQRFRPKMFCFENKDFKVIWHQSSFTFFIR